MVSVSADCESNVHMAGFIQVFHKIIQLYLPVLCVHPKLASSIAIVAFYLLKSLGYLP